MSTMTFDQITELVHPATDDGEGFCHTCGARVRRVPGGRGPTYVHSDTGAVAGRTPAAVLAVRHLAADWTQRATELSPERPDTWENTPEEESDDTLADAYAECAAAMVAAVTPTTDGECECGRPAVATVEGRIRACRDCADECAAHGADVTTP